jgi:thymidylate synthase (FAD)
MRRVEPAVFLIARPSIDLNALDDYLQACGGQDWWEGKDLHDLRERAGETIVEISGRMCYRSWAPGLNANVTRVRTESDDYLRNIVAQNHGSVLEHASYTFVFHNVSRVFTHELVRHRAGVAISQESMRYVRLTDIPVWMPEWVDSDLAKEIEEITGLMESFQVTMADRFGLDDPGVPFAEKKAKTSFMRRMAPDGVATGIVWTANLRTLRHVIEMRTSPGAEEEIRLIFDLVAQAMVKEAPNLFSDFTRSPDGTWTPEHRKI